jgi:hypothetical protein
LNASTARRSAAVAASVATTKRLGSPADLSIAGGSSGRWNVSSFRIL